MIGIPVCLIPTLVLFPDLNLQPHAILTQVTSTGVKSMDSGDSCITQILAPSHISSVTLGNFLGLSVCYLEDNKRTQFIWGK